MIKEILGVSLRIVKSATSVRKLAKLTAKEISRIALVGFLKNSAADSQKKAEEVVRMIPRAVKVMLFFVINILRDVTASLYFSRIPS